MKISKNVNGEHNAERCAICRKNPKLRMPGSAAPDGAMLLRDLATELVTSQDALVQVAARATLAVLDRL